MPPNRRKAPPMDNLKPRQKKQKDEDILSPSELMSSPARTLPARSPSIPISSAASEDYLTTEFVNERNEGISWLKSVLKQQKEQYALLYKRTKKLKYHKKTAHELQKYYADRTETPECKKCKDRRFKILKLKKDLADRVHRIEVTLNAKEELLKKMRTLDPKIQELEVKNAELELNNIRRQDDPTLFSEKVQECFKVYYRAGRAYDRLKETQKEIENQIKIETQEKKEVLDDLASVKKEFIEKEVEVYYPMAWWQRR